MKNYSIVRVGNEYVVQAGEKSVLKIASRRRAERTVTDAAELLDSLPSPALRVARLRHLAPARSPQGQIERSRANIKRRWRWGGVLS